MNLLQYDAVVRIVEDNITESKKEIEKKVDKLLALNSREANLYFKSINPDQMTVVQYIRYRQTIRGLKEYIGEPITIEDICYKYHFSDSTNFNNSVKMYTGEVDPPSELKRAGYVCPEPKYLEDILQIKGRFETDEKRIVDLENTVEAMQRNMDMLKSQNEKYIMEISYLHNEKKEMEGKVERAIRKNKQDEKKEITYKEYTRFLEIEDLRVMYNFSTSEILELYKESIETGKSLEKLCDEALDSCRFWIYTFDESDYIDELPNQSYYEMGIMESYNYYYSDEDEADLEADPYENEDFEYSDYDYSDMYSESDWLEMEGDIEEQDDFEIEKIIKELEEEKAQNAFSEAKKNGKDDVLKLSDTDDLEIIPF